MAFTRPAGTFAKGYGRRTDTIKAGDTVCTVTIEDDGSAVFEVVK